MTTSGSTGGSGIDYTWDALGRKTSEASYGRKVASQYDVMGNRTRLTYPDGNYVQYSYDHLNRLTVVQQVGSPVLASYAYDDLGRVSSLSRYNGTTTSYSYSGTSLDWSLSQDMASTGQDVTFGLTFTPAIQVQERSISKPAYAFSAPALTRSYTANGLNQYASVGGTTYSYDARANLTSDGPRTFAYDLENRLTSVSGSASMTLAYDPKGPMRQTAASATQQYLYDGDDLIVEYDNGGTILRRYVPGRGEDENLVWYEGSNLSTPSWLQTDQQGSVVAVSNASASGTLYRYSPSGEPYGGWSGSAATPIFRYTGQAALPQIGLYYYKARMYDPVLGRFLQTDPIGYKDDWNLYAYVGNDPANKVDPSGFLCQWGSITFSDGTRINFAPTGCSLDTDSSGRNTASMLQGGTLPGANANAAVARPQSINLLNHSMTSKMMSPEQREEEARKDERICRQVQSRSCWETAAIRDSRRATGKPVPPPELEVGKHKRDVVDPANKAARAASVAAIIYWIISEGSRIIPLRNLVPIP